MKKPNPIAKHLNKFNKKSIMPDKRMRETLKRLEKERRKDA
tara:strand:+ start:310 stop:432 length:123 start_codon:yes stop_codon:yes gene_type:complete